MKTRIFAIAEPQVTRCSGVFFTTARSVLRVGLRSYTHAGCYARRFSLALAYTRDVTLADLLLHLHACGMLR